MSGLAVVALLGVAIPNARGEQIRLISPLTGVSAGTGSTAIGTAELKIKTNDAAPAQADKKTGSLAPMAALNSDYNVNLKITVSGIDRHDVVDITLRSTDGSIVDSLLTEESAKVHSAKDGFSFSLKNDDLNVSLADLLSGKLSYSIGTKAYEKGEIGGAVTQVPEPGTLAMIASGGLVGLAWFWRRKRG